MQNIYTNIRRGRLGTRVVGLWKRKGEKKGGEWEKGRGRGLKEGKLGKGKQRSKWNLKRKGGWLRGKGIGK